MRQCTICGKPAKYTCPACESHSCSLHCVREHKESTQCSGKLDPTRHISRDQLLTPISLDRDYNFLQSMGRSIQIESHSRHRKDRIDKRDFQRGGVKVRRVPTLMSRSQRNKSAWSKADREYIWTVDIDDSTIQWPESRKISEMAPERALSLVDASGEVYRLVSDLPLGEALKGHTIVEYPKIITSKLVSEEKVATPLTTSDSEHPAECNNSGSATTSPPATSENAPADGFDVIPGDSSEVQTSCPTSSPSGNSH